MSAAYIRAGGTARTLRSLAKGMSVFGKNNDALDVAIDATRTWLTDLDTAPVNASQDVDQVAAAFPQDFPAQGLAPADVVSELVRAATPGLVATPSGRYFGWVRGGVLDSALAADWLTAAWDQNASLLVGSPAGAAAERVAGDWILQALDLPETTGVGFVTGGMMANFTCLAAARHRVFNTVGWNVERDGLIGAPRLQVFVGKERHATVDLALRYLGLGQAQATVIPADEQGRIRPDLLEQELAAAEAASPGAPRIVVLQAGNVHSGCFDSADAVDIAHRYNAWVHVDGAFGLWAAATPGLEHLTAGLERADSWATDAHKTLNVPYDSGLALVRDASALHAAMGERADYLIQDDRPDPLATVPEFSRRARGFTVLAALRELGREGLAEMVETFAVFARRFAATLGAIEGVTILNDVVYTQVCVAFASDDETHAVAAALMAEGTTWMTPSRWHGRAVLRVSVSNARTTADDVERSLAAICDVLNRVRAAQQPESHLPDVQA